MEKKYLNKLSRIIVILFSVMLITACDNDFDQDKNSNEYTDFSDDERKDTKPTSAVTKDDSKKEDTGVTGKDDTDEKKDNEDDKSDSDSVKREPEITKEPEITEAPENKAESAMKALTSKLEERYAEFKNNKANVWINLSKDVYYNYDSDRYFVNNTAWRADYNWYNYDQIMQFVYSFVDLDNDGINELIICELTDIGTDFDYSQFTIYKWYNNDVTTMLNESNCIGFGFDSYDNSWGYSFRFNNDYTLLCIDYDEANVYYKLNEGKYDMYASMVYGMEYAAYYENGVEKHGDFQLVNECDDMIRNNQAQLNMSIYEYMENPFTPKEQANLFKPLSDSAFEMAKKDGHISENPQNYIIDDIDDNGADEVIINDNYELLIYKYDGDILRYKDKDIYHDPNDISYDDYDYYDYSYNISFEYYNEEKVIHCNNSYSYLSIPGTVFGSYDYYCSLDKYSNLTEWEIHTYEDIDFHDQEYFREDVTVYKKNGEKVSEQEFKKAQPKGRHCEILPGNVVNKSDFIFYDSDRRYLEKDELLGLTDDELSIARNEIYARHGYIFTTNEIAIEYFNSKQWYRDIKNKISKNDFHEDKIFNKFEKANRDLIQAIEREREKERKK